MDLELENRNLRQRLQKITQDAQQNQATLKRFHARELELLSANSLPELLNSLTDGMLHSFQVETIQLLLKDPEHEIRRLLYNTGVPETVFAHIQFVDDLALHHPRYQRLRRPWLGPFISSEHNGLFKQHQGIHSMAILPIHCRDLLIGSLNLGSHDTERFTRQHASDFLERLGTISGVCLENAVNRERLVLSGLTDSLTRLHNRRYLDRRLDEELARSSRYAQPLSCLFIDADHFKQINDQYGHQIGDMVLRELANRIRSQLRASDVATRYGGEEFAVLLPQTTLDEALHLAERIRLEVSNHPISIEDQQDIQLTVSIGVSETIPSRGRSLEPKLAQQLLACADQAVYQAKRNGRNRIEHQLVEPQQPVQSNG